MLHHANDQVFESLMDYYEDEEDEEVDDYSNSDIDDYGL